MTAGPTLWDVNDVSRALKVSPHTVRRWAAQNKLRRIKLGSRTLFDPAEVALFVEQARASTTTTQTERQEQGDEKPMTERQK